MDDLMRDVQPQQGWLYRNLEQHANVLQPAASIISMIIEFLSLLVQLDIFKMVKSVEDASRSVALRIAYPLPGSPVPQRVIVSGNTPYLTGITMSSLLMRLV